MYKIKGETKDEQKPCNRWESNTHTHTPSNLNKKKTGILKCLINNVVGVDCIDPLKDRNIVYFCPFLYAKKHTEFY